MTLTGGTRLGPYEILSALGAGGMGEVYRARDSRLGRDVAIKVLLAEVATDRDRLRRFELEARAASALNHPHIVAIYDVGSSDVTFYTAMEFVDGSTLREIVEAGPLATRRLLDIAVQIADGLAKAHEAGIVHRDLKPENVMVSRDGYVKILDFGLAKLSESHVQDVSEVATGTRPGMVMGTVGYMSPEQASGRAVDFRSDQFSLGSILYELATGQRAFRRDTHAETLTAIIREEPRPIAQRNAGVPAPFRWIVERCLSKEPDGRYASTRDLARDLAMVREHLSEIGSGETAQVEAPSAAAEIPVPTFQRLSFRRGTILSARFALDGQTVIYGASWDGEPVRLFSNRPESPESSPLMLPDAEVLSISRSGQLAVSLDRRWAGRFIWSGTLAQVPIVGGAPRELADDVQWADWAPDGSNLAVVRTEAGKARLEYPIGTPAVRDGRLDQPSPRVSRRRSRRFPRSPRPGGRLGLRRDGGPRREADDAFDRLDHGVRTRLVGKRPRDLVHRDAGRRRARHLGRLPDGPGAVGRAHARRADDPGRLRGFPRPHDERQREGGHHRPAARAGEGARPVAARLVPDPGSLPGRPPPPLRRVGRGGGIPPGCLPPKDRRLAGRAPGGRDGLRNLSRRPMGSLALDRPSRKAAGAPSGEGRTAVGRCRRTD